MTNLPRMFILELACDGCDRPDTVIDAANAREAWDKATANGWRHMIGNRMYCPSCAANPPRTGGLDAARRRHERRQKR